MPRAAPYVAKPPSEVLRVKPEGVCNNQSSMLVEGSQARACSRAGGAGHALNAAVAANIDELHCGQSLVQQAFEPRTPSARLTVSVVVYTYHQIES